MRPVTGLYGPLNGVRFCKSHFVTSIFTTTYVGLHNVKKATYEVYIKCYLRCKKATYGVYLELYFR